MSPAPAHSIATRPYGQLPKSQDKPAASHYTPPSDLTPGMVNRRFHPLFTDGDTQISRIIDWDPSVPQQPRILGHYLLVETGLHGDHIHVRSWPGDTLQILINGKPHVVDIEHKAGQGQELWIDTKGGDDEVIIDNDVTLRVSVEGGAGNDRIQAGGGRSRLYGGRGDDFLQLGSGLGYAAGNDGNDTIVGGSGNAVMYGNKGEDLLIAGFGLATRQTYLDGGDDDDVLVSGSGHTVSHGGNGNDFLVGHTRTTFYTGKGQDHIVDNKRTDLIYAKATDTFERTRGSTFTEVKPSNAGHLGFTVDVSSDVPKEQSQEYKQRVADDFEFLRSSPLGQQTLAKMDELAVANGAPVTIEPSDKGNQAYYFGRTVQEGVTPAHGTETEANWFITNGAPGSRADDALITYDAPSVIESADRTNTVVPVTVLVHEIGHAYNGATGTALRGQTAEHLESGESQSIENYERQVVGLANTAEPFDLDSDPSTPPSTVNPKPFTENALNEEMGKPLRTTYSVRTSFQGDGT